MDFFEAQARAKQRSSRLVLMFALAVMGTVVAMYFAALLILGQANGRSVQYDEYGTAHVVSTGGAFSWWEPQLFFGVTVATLAVVGLGSLYKWSQFSAGGRAVADSVGGRLVDPHTRDLKERQLLNVVEEMAIASGVAVPAVYIMDQEPAINAFAAGLTTNDAVVAVTRGTLEKLNRDELQGVIGHEFSHILNGDMRLNLRIAALIFGILVLGVVGRGILWSLRGARVRNSKNSGGGVAVIIAIGLALVVIGYIGYFFGRLIQAAVSRQREFLADASAVQFTRNPAGIAGALKKIGGYALGSNLQTNQSAAIGHFFFSQAFRTGITGLWATHPPLDERIRAVDPSFDGKFFEPPEVVDVERESFVSAGLAPARPRSEAPPELATHIARAPAPPPIVASGSNAAVAGVATVGQLTPEQIASAHVLLEATPERLRTATQSHLEARALLYGLLLDQQGATRDRQLGIIAEHGGEEPLRVLRDLEPALRDLHDEQRLPLVQLALSALRQVPPAERHAFLATLDDLIRVDEQISPFEFALQRLLTHALELNGNPERKVVQYYAFQGLVDELNSVLSVLARASTSDSSLAPRAFAAGAAQLSQIAAQLSYSDALARNLGTFDAALDQLALASLPIKQRALMAAAHVVQADGRVLVCEYELLRAVAAALDVPMPPLAPGNV